MSGLRARKDQCALTSSRASADAVRIAAQLDTAEAWFAEITQWGPEMPEAGSSFLGCLGASAANDTPPAEFLRGPTGVRAPPPASAIGGFARIPGWTESGRSLGGRRLLLSSTHVRMRCTMCCARDKVYGGDEHRRVHA
jgi:hypothetical protein